MLILAICWHVMKSDKKFWHNIIFNEALLYLPTQICFLIAGEDVLCCGSKLANSLGQTKLTNSLRKKLICDQVILLKLREICMPGGINQTIFCSFSSIFELGGKTKHFMSGTIGNTEFCFPSTSMFSSALDLAKTYRANIGKKWKL